MAAPTSMPTVLTIAGSDSGGGAGIQADIKAIEANGCFATSALTAVTAQNTEGVQAVSTLSSSFVREQLEAVLDDLPPAAIKTGMLATGDIIETVTDAVQSIDCPLVIDPVMVAASGDRLLDETAEQRYEDLIAQATIVTPNADEAAVLTGIDINGIESSIAAGEAILEVGANAALIKGGHVAGDPVTDVLVTDADTITFEHERIDTDAVHGSGCTLASSIAANLAHGHDLANAVEMAIASLHRSIRYHYALGTGPGPVHHLAALRNDAAFADTVDAVRHVVAGLVDAGASEIIPEVGMNVVGAMPHAEAPHETVAVDGRIVRSIDGVEPVGDVRPGASGHVARLLLAVREHDPSMRFAANCRFDADTEAAMESLGWHVTEIDRQNEPADHREREGTTMQWIAHRAWGDADNQPVAVFDRGDPGKEAMTRIVATDEDQLLDRLVTLAAARE